MNLTNRGISRVVPVVIVLVIVAVAAIAYYLVSTTTTSPSPTSSSSTLVSSSLSSTPSSTTSIPSSTTTSSTQSSTTTTESSTTSSPSSTTFSTTSSTTSTAACLTISPSNSTEEQELVGWFGNYSSLAVTFNGTKDGKAVDLTLSYTVAYKGPPTYKVNLNIVLNGKSHPYTLWDLSNGTVLALLAPNGVNSTGSAASNTVLNYFYDLETLYTLALQSTNTAYFHSTGTSSVTIGTNSFTVTNYVTNTTPETIQGCNNSGYGSVSTSNVNLGTPSGSSFELVTSSTFVGSITDASGTTTTLDFTYQTTALTVA